MLTPTQKRSAQAIVNIFETNSVSGNYGSVAVIKGDTGHLSFGRSQVTLGSGNLYNLLNDYCRISGARFGSDITTYLQRLKSKDFSLDNDSYFKNILRATADDSIMRETQDVYFDRNFWQLAERRANQMGVTTPLGVAVIYDSTIQGSWTYVRDLTNSSKGTIENLGENLWIKAYADTRYNWLAGHTRADLRNSAYRMDALKRLIELNLWGLNLPFVVRGIEISLATLNATPHGSYSSPQPGARIISVQTPLLRGLDVRMVQLGLSKRRIEIIADGVFGNVSAIAIKNYQSSTGRPATGVADMETIAELIS